MPTGEDAFDHHITLLERTPAVFVSIAGSLSDEQARRRPSTDEWSLSELLAHLRACAEVWGDDIARMLSANEPRFTRLHPRRVMLQPRFQDVSFVESASAFATLRVELLRTLRGLDTDSLNRGATINRQHHTIASHLRRMAGHEAHHDAQIRDMIAFVRGDGI